MKLKDVLEQRNEKFRDYIGEILFSELNIYNCSFTYISDDDEHLKCYFISRWYCTDTYVGLRAYYLDGELVCMSFQSGRRMNEEFTWINNEMKKKTKNYILSLQTDEDENECDFLDLEQEMGFGFQRDFSMEVLADEVIYIPQQKLVKVVKRYPVDYVADKNYKHRLIGVELDGEIVDVKLTDILIPYNS